MDADRTAPAFAEGQVRVAAAPERVWDLIVAMDEWPSWNPDIAVVQLEGPVEVGSTFRWGPKRASITSVLGVVDAPRELAWTGVTMGIHAVHVFRFEPDGEGGTIVRSEESWRGFLASLLKGPSRRTLQRGIDGWLARLKVAAEGE